MLVERDRLLADLVARAHEAAAGHGRLVFVGGEAGVGKSALVRALAAALPDRFARRMGAADNVTTAEALAAVQEAVPEIVPLLDGARPAVFRGLRAALAAGPALVVLEDLHWADEATLDAVRHLGRRLEGVPALVVATYRHDEVGPRDPLTRVLGELAGRPDVERIVVPPLTADGVARLAAGSGAQVDPAVLHARTGGNAFFVSEVLAAGDESIPATVRDAVLARASRLGPDAADLLAAAAVLGAPSDPAVLVAIAGVPPAAVDEALDAGVLVETEPGVGFRHELARQAIEQSTSVMRRRQLHRRALRVLTERTPADHRTLAHHADAAGDDTAALRHAVLAARRAARLGAHREAAAQYRFALRAAAPAPRAERAGLFAALAYECYLTDQIPEAITARHQALELYELERDALRVGDTHRWLSRLSWFAGRNDDAERAARRAIDTLEPLGASSELAMAYSNLAQLRMLAADDEAAEREGGRALALAAQLGDREVEIHALNNVGSAVMRGGRFDEGAAMLRRSLELALADDLPEHVARAYTNLGSAPAQQHRLHEAIRMLEDGVAYCEERDLDSWARYMDGWRAEVLGELGQWDEALSIAERLLAHPDISPISAISAAAVAARIAARRGGDAAPMVRRAVELAERTGELQRMLPASTAAAEAAWLAGRPTEIGAATDAAWALAVAHDDPWAVGELAWWRSLAGIPAAAAEHTAEPFALLLAGRFAEAADVWRAIGAEHWAATALALAPSPDDALRAMGALDALGATASIDALLRVRRDAGLPLPRRPRAGTRANPGELTSRELDVLGLLADGLSTAEIADRLVLSARTVEHHVGAILRKLGEPSRARAVASARRDGVLP